MKLNIGIDLETGKKTPLLNATQKRQLLAARKICRAIGSFDPDANAVADKLEELASSKEENDVVSEQEKVRSDPDRR